ncbi:GNAT family N-acetyltransferase [Amycolatopsis granulosa]|uniref:GNAT family N-acetyltransferase n=1 Tax=Amycolatopsis granulosa TaxID=185684 RepID=UPI0014219813|nr:GNAT family N-acetyltransferase [Amycolatopsis granulosa]NIH88459.1 GNAT superfamily N-acetyltransferase [Amycolatopsis granulosa]
MPEIEIRPAGPEDHEAVAGLRWRWVAERDGPPGTGRDTFVREFATWAREHAGTHRCLVLVRAGRIAGMGFLAVTARVPSPGSLTRASGDIQCVYVVPEARGAGLGGRLIGELLALARQLGLERVTVHSSARAVPVYARTGFTVSPRLRQISIAAGPRESTVEGGPAGRTPGRPAR